MPNGVQNQGGNGAAHPPPNPAVNPAGNQQVNQVNPPANPLANPNGAGIPQNDLVRLLDNVTQSIDLLRVQTNANARAPFQRQRPRSINCRVFKIGENWKNFASHFVECVRAAYGYILPAEQAELNAACLIWAPSKLESGTTLIAYENLAPEEKVTWPLLNAALTRVFMDETEKETFLADMASFKRGHRPLLEYKNELMRLVTTHQPDLDRNGNEFQRQLTSRFIEGLDDEELRRDLRRYCKRARKHR